MTWCEYILIALILTWVEAMLCFATHRKFRILVSLVFHSVWPSTIIFDIVAVACVTRKFPKPNVSEYFK